MKKVVRKIQVGLIVPSFCDQRYLRDRDCIIPLIEGEDEKTAITLWKKEVKGWLRADEVRYIQTKEIPLEGYFGYEIIRAELYND